MKIIVETLGIYITKKGESFACHFFSDHKLAFGVGPLPQEGVGSRGIEAQVSAESEEEARNKLKSALGEGSFFKT